MMKARTVARIAEASRPRPAAIPTASSEPEASRSRQSVNLPRLILLEDRPGPEEPDAGNDPLQNAAHIREQHSGLVWNQGKKCSAKGDEHMRPQSRLLPFLFPLEPQETTE